MNVRDSNRVFGQFMMMGLGGVEGRGVLMMSAKERKLHRKILFAIFLRCEHITVKSFFPVLLAFRWSRSFFLFSLAVNRDLGPTWYVDRWSSRLADCIQNFAIPMLCLCLRWNGIAQEGRRKEREAVSKVRSAGRKVTRRKERKKYNGSSAYDQRWYKIELLSHFTFSRRH